MRFSRRSVVTSSHSRLSAGRKEYAKAALATQLGGTIRNANGAPQPMKDQGAGYVARYEATYGFRPFPQSEISLSDGVLKQNAGWTGADSKYTNWK